MTVSIDTAFQAIKFVKKNIANISGDNQLLMANIVNSRVRDFAININPEDFIKEETIFIKPNVDTYAIPTDFQNHLASARSGLFSSRGGNTFQSLEFKTKTGVFTVGQVLTGTTSGATATIDQIEDNGTTGFIKLSSVTGVFTAGEAITDPITGAAVNVESIPYENSDAQLNLTHANSQKIGFFTRGTDYVITPAPIVKDIYLNRYFPILTEMTVTTDTFVEVNAPNGKYTELLRDLLLVEYEVFDRDEELEQSAEARANELLREFFNTVSKEPQVFIFEE